MAVEAPTFDCQHAQGCGGQLTCADTAMVMVSKVPYGIIPFPLHELTYLDIVLRYDSSCFASRHTPANQRFSALKLYNSTTRLQ